MEVSAAFWLKPFDTDRWILHIAAPMVDREGTLPAYREVLRVVRSLGTEQVFGDEIKLIGAKDPLVRESRSVLERHPHGFPIHPPEETTRGEMQVYRLGKVVLPLYGMVFKGEPGGGALHLSFVPFAPNSRMMVGDEVYPAETGIDYVVAAPAGSRLDQDERGTQVLTWNLQGKEVRSSPNEIWSFARLGMHGFGFQKKPKG